MRTLTTAARAVMLGMLAALLAGPVAADPPDTTSGAVSAVWTAKDIHFVYMGFTSRFSCDGLADRMKKVLLLLGARKDLQVSPTPCASPFGRPDPFPGVTVKMNVLEPAGSNPACPQASPTTPSSCVFRISPQGAATDAVGVGAAVTLLGPGPAVVVSDTTTGQFDLVRYS